MAGIAKGPFGYTVFNEHFKTKSKLVDRIRAILYTYEPGDSLSLSDKGFIVDLLKNHPRAAAKIGCGVLSIEVEINQVYKSNRGFWLTRFDGSRTDFSFLECITPDDYQKHFRVACRNAVVSQIQDFKTRYFLSHANQDGMIVCPITGELVNKFRAHVDHVSPETFESIVADFISEKNVNLRGIEYTG